MIKQSLCISFTFLSFINEYIFLWFPWLCYFAQWRKDHLNACLSKRWLNGIETCKISCMKRVASPGSMHNTGCLGLVHWDDPHTRGMVWGGRREEGSGWGTHVYLWRIHFDIWQNQYNIVKLKNKITLKKRKENNFHQVLTHFNEQIICVYLYLIVHSVKLN